MTESQETNCSLPLYKSHKTVRAVQIAGIIHKPNPDLTGKSGASSYGATLYPAEVGHAQFDVSAEYMNKHQPKVGGYYVLYEDGYASYSPAKAFEEGYKLVCDAPEMLALPVIDPSMVPQSTEQAIVAAGANVAPRVTPEHIAGLIVSEHYFRADEGVFGAARNPMEAGRPMPAEFRVGDYPLYLLTFCVLVLRNGFTVTGESACASPANFNAEIGRRIARENAVEKIWPLEGYLLRQRLHEGAKS